MDIWIFRTVPRSRKSCGDGERAVSPQGEDGRGHERGEVNFRQAMSCSYTIFKEVAAMIFLISRLTSASETTSAAAYSNLNICGSVLSTIST